MSYWFIKFLWNFKSWFLLRCQIHQEYFYEITILHALSQGQYIINKNIDKNVVKVIEIEKWFFFMIRYASAIWNRCLISLGAILDFEILIMDNFVFESCYDKNSSIRISFCNVYFHNLFYTFHIPCNNCLYWLCLCYFLSMIWYK